MSVATARDGTATSTKRTSPARSSRTASRSRAVRSEIGVVGALEPATDLVIDVFCGRETDAVGDAALTHADRRDQAPILGLILGQSHAQVDAGLRPRLDRSEGTPWGDQGHVRFAVLDLDLAEAGEQGDERVV